jgi:beta-glucosidase
MTTAVTAAQPRTVVTLNVPGAVLMPWAAAAGAIISAWFPGQEMGNALADVLWGDVNPSGRLPLTFPVSNADTPMQVG